MDVEYQLNRLEFLTNTIRSLIEEAGKVASLLQLQTSIPHEAVVEATTTWLDSTSHEKFGIEMPSLPWYDFVLEYYKDLIADAPQEN